MSRSLHRTAALLVLAGMLAACAGGAQSHVRGANRNLIDADDIARARQTDAYALIQALRPHWFEVRGAGARMVKLVYLDEILVGRVDVLRQISTATVGSIRYWDGPAAMQRWGTDHAAGAIQVFTRTQ
jgi:hypothetical protein